MFRLQTVILTALVAASVVRHNIMFRFQAVILTALVAASVPVNAYDVAFFKDFECTSTQMLFNLTTLDPRSCTNFPNETGSFFFNNPSLNTIQLFTGTDCAPTPPLFQSAESQPCYILTEAAAFSFNVVAPTINLDSISEDVQCPAKIPADGT